MGESPQPVTWLRYVSRRMFLTHSTTSRDLSTDLRRCLSTWRLTLLGLGPTVGIGMFVLPGHMARDVAGPSVVLSILIACVVTMLNTMVFAEFSTNICQAGAQYIYLYKVFGEFAAFLAGSILVVVGILTASVGSQGWSGIIDSYLDNVLHNYTTSVLGKNPLGIPFSDTPNVLAFLLQIGITLFVCVSVMCTSTVTAVLAVMNCFVLTFVLACGLIYGDSQNFLNEDAGGIFPFGAEGVFKAAFLAIFAVSEFEMTAMSAEEAEQPAKSIPRAMGASLAIVTVLYIGTVVGMLFLSPYWLLDELSPLPSGFAHSGLPWGKLVVTLVSVVGLSNLQIVTLYSTSRCMYRMSKDGLLFSFFLKVDKHQDIPLRAVVCAGLASSVISMLFDLTHLIQLTVVFKVVSYIAVASALIRLRVTQNEAEQFSRPLLYNGKDENAIMNTPAFLCELKHDHEDVLLTLQGTGTKRTESKSVGELSEKSMNGVLKCKDDNSFVTSDAEMVNKDSQVGLCLENLNANGKGGKPCVVVEESNAHEYQQVQSVDSGSRASNGSHNWSTKPPLLKTLNENKSGQQLIPRFDGINNINLHVLATSSEAFELIYNETKLQGSSLEETSRSNETNASVPLHQSQYGAVSDHSVTEEEPWPDRQYTSLGQSQSENSGICDVTLASRAADWLSPVIPRVVSCNVLILLHLLSCVVLAKLIHSSCWTGGQLEVVIATVVMSLVLVVFSLLLWPFCAEWRNKDREAFQTTTMPLIPTLSIVSSTAMLLVGSQQKGAIELLSIVLLASIGYLVMTYFRFVKEGGGQVKGEKQTLVSDNGNQRTHPIQNGGLHQEEHSST